MQSKTEQHFAQSTRIPTFNSTVIYVKEGGTGGDGTSWATAFRDLQKALDKAHEKLNAGETNIEIWLAAGTYTPTNKVGGTDARNATFQLINNTIIYGGFSGGETVLTERNYEENKTILSGNIGTENVYHVFYHPQNLELNATAGLDGVTISRGNAHGIYPHSNGGGMYNYKSSPTLKHVKFYDNNAKDCGGGMYNWKKSNPILTDVTFCLNKSIRVGGGMYNLNSSPLLTNVIFHANEANDGGGMYNIRNNSPLINIKFSENVANNDGGGMYNISSSPALKDVIFNGNVAKNGGGGIYNWWYSCNPSLTNVNFSGNVARIGGGMYNECSKPQLINVIFSENKAEKSGCNMYNRNSRPNLVNVTIDGNGEEATYGRSGVIRDHIHIETENEPEPTHSETMDLEAYKFPFSSGQIEINSTTEDRNGMKQK